DPFDRGAAANAVGQQRREGLDLGRQVRRGVEQEPAPAVRTDGGAALRPRPGPRGLGPSQAAVDTATVPLRETAPCRGAQQTYAHARIPRLTPRAVARRLAVGRAFGALGAVARRGRRLVAHGPGIGGAFRV